MDYQKLKILYKKYCNNSLNPSEFEELSQLIEDVDFKSLLGLSSDEQFENDFTSSFDKEEVFKRISSNIDDLEGVKKNSYSKHKNALFVKIAAAVAVFFIISYSFFYYKKENTKEPNINANLITPIALDEHKNINTIEFADGKTLDLDFLPNDSISYKGLSLFRKGENELLIRNDEVSAEFDVHSFHMFAAKKGTVLKLTLPDNSTVHLNSGSSINISSSYGISNRNVMLKGEGFFEIAHDKLKPFIVEVKDAKVNVLGTIFNLSGYDQDKNVKATLISGSIAISKHNDKAILKPGQQATVNNNNAIEVVSNVDLTQILSWRDGVFRFKDESIESILNEVSKWYDIKEIEIANNINDKFTGSIKRTKQLEDVLNAIEEVSDLKFKIVEGRVIVMK